MKPHIPNYRILAPGKVMLMGEYGVLEQGAGLVAAVDRYASGCLAETARSVSSFIPVIKQHTKGDFPIDNLQLDVADFFDKAGAKLGIGSSAASIVCAVGLFMEWNHQPIEYFQTELYSQAFNIHKAWQHGLGSGADIKAAVYGGIIRINSIGEPLRSIPLAMRWISHRSSVQTRQLLQQYHQHRADGKKIAYQMSELAEKFILSSEKQNTKDMIACVEQASNLYDELALLIRAPLVSVEQKKIIALAQQHGGQAKPSGAGGGDLTWAVFPTETQAEEFSKRLDADYQLLSLDFSTVGAHKV